MWVTGAVSRVKVHQWLSQPVPPGALWTQKQLKDSWNVADYKIPNCLQALGKT